MASYTGWLAIILQVLVLVLAIRTPLFNRLFHGLKAQLRLHHYLALASVTALVAHLGIVTLEFANDLPTLFDFTEPSLLSAWLAFVLQHSVIGFAFLYGIISYRRWRWIHLLTVLAFFGTFSHVYLISEPIGWVQHAYFWLPLVAGSAAIVTSSLLPALPIWGNSYTVRKNTEIMPGIYRLNIHPATLKDGICFLPGQFIYLKFLDPLFSRLWHPFTIVSRSGCGPMELLIKDRGRDTHNLKHLRDNSNLRISGPFGTFLWLSANKQLWIGQGIGIAIFIAGMRSLGEDPSRQAHLIYCVANEDDIIFRDEIAQVGKNTNAFTWEAFLGDGYQFVEDLNNRIQHIIDFELIRICGHPAFQRNCRRTLIALGIPKNKIQLEGLR